MKRVDWQNQDIRALAVIASLLISLVNFLFPGIPNDDAYVYFRTAEIFLSDGFTAASIHYSWPGYAVLLAIVSKLGISLHSSALLLNAMFYALITWTFVSIVKLLSDSKLVVGLAALSILLYPELNEFRVMVIRDTGFWALNLFALWQLMLFLRSGKFSAAMWCTASLLFAALFRLEATLYLVAVPLIAFLPFNSDSTHSLGKEAKWTLAALIYGSLILAVLLSELLGIDVIFLALEFASTYVPFINNLLGHPENYALLSDQLSATHGEDIAEQFASVRDPITLLSTLVATLIAGISGAYIWLLLFGLAIRCWPARTSLPREMLAWISINAALVLGFLVLTGFLSSRYVMVLGLMMATQIPFIIAATLHSTEDEALQKKMRIGLTLFLIFCFFDAHISFGRSRAYLQNSADYLAAHVATGEEILTNNHSIAYASRLVEHYDQVSRTPEAERILALSSGSYLALELVPQVESMLDDVSLDEVLEFVTAFPTEAEPIVAIYRRQ